MAKRFIDSFRCSSLMPGGVSFLDLPFTLLLAIYKMETFLLKIQLF